MSRRLARFLIVFAALSALGFGDAGAQMGFGGFGGGFSGGGRGFGNGGFGPGMARSGGGGFGASQRMGRRDGNIGGARHESGGYRRNPSANTGPRRTAHEIGGYGQAASRQPKPPYPGKIRPPRGPIVIGQGPGRRPPRHVYNPPRFPRFPIGHLPVAPPVVAGPSVPASPRPFAPPRPVLSSGGGQGASGATGGPSQRAIPPARAAVAPPPADETRYVVNEVLIRTGAQTSPAAIGRIERRLGLVPLAVTRIALLDSDLRRYRVPAGTSVGTTIQALGGETAVASAQPNYLFELQDDLKFDYPKPNDPMAAEAAARDTKDTRSLEPTTRGTTSPALPHEKPSPSANVAVAPEYSAQYAVDTMRLAGAHKIATGMNALIAIIDTGLDETNPEIADRIAGRLDVVGGTFTPHPHGTGMAGVIVAHKSLTGIAPDAKLLAIRAFQTMTKGAQGTSYDIVRGLDFAAAHKAQIINMSFAGPRDPLLADALTAAREKGMIEVAAAGNAGPNSQPLYPAAEPGVIAITATDTHNRLYAMANRGAYVTAAAPGVDVIAPSTGGAIQLSSGTSIAAAEASGVIALLLEHHPQMGAAEIRKVLVETALSSSEETAAGNQIIDAYAALQATPQEVRQPVAAGPPGAPSPRGGAR